MSYLLNTAASFTEDMVTGFVTAYPDTVRRVQGGVVRTDATPPGQVALVIGGGSGHYPAFAGLVGPGLAHGAAMGNVFASPSAHQVYSVAKAAASDSGVLLSYGNYAGDVLNFDAAQERLNLEGIATRTVVVTDDVSSAPADERARRRGVAGDLSVFRAAAWAAANGESLDEVEAFARLANDRTRTLGVAFSGCTLPGADQPLFTVPPGRMAVGMGIHGEPGLSERPLGSAAEIADLLVDGLLAERVDGDRIGIILNGLGSVKSEELFVLYAAVAPRLQDAGLTVVQPEIGEYATSFEMAGVSLTVTWLDDRLEQAWCAPAAAPGYQRGEVVRTTTAGTTGPGDADAEDEVLAAGSPESYVAAGRIVAALRAIGATLDGHVDELGRLDAVAGDGDHGIGMQRGASAAIEAAERAHDAGAGAASTLASAADAWADRGGGTSGALWGIGLRAVADRLGDDGRPEASDVVAGVRDAVDAVARAGKVQVGDRTMLDAADPFARALADADGVPFADAWATAARAAHEAADATAQLRPRAGRARTHADKGVGTPDPGAVSFALIVTAVGESLSSSQPSAVS